VSLQSICKHIDVELAMFLWVLDTTDTQETMQYRGSIVEQKQVQEVLDGFPSVFA